MIRSLLLAATALCLSCPAAHAETPAPPIAAPADAPPPGRLPATVKPVAYRLDLTVDPAKERFSGKVEIDTVLASPAALIWLHGRDLAMARAVAVVNGRALPGEWRQMDETGVARLTFAEPLPAGPVTFAFTYDAPFGSGPAGMFRVKVGDDWYSWTQHESIDARASFPSFDEPGFKTPFTVTLRTPRGLTAVSNGPETATGEEGGLTVHRFAQTLPLPTYLVAMMVGPFAVVEGSVPPTPERAQPLPLRIVSPRPNAEQLYYALEHSKAIVALLENYFGQSFPYPKLDQITAPIMPGAMENAGADLYGDNIIVLDDHAPIPRQRRFGMIVAHELAHQWFGDLVTPAWWDDIWLNESFANWMGYRIGGAWRPDLNIGAGATAEGFDAMNTDALVAGRPIRQDITSNSQIDAAFDRITYGKGGHVVAMIAAYMGDDRFREGVRRYMAAHRYGNATSADFFRAMAEVSGDPRILPAMQGFVNQQGVPLLTFRRDGQGWRVEQSRYARLGTIAPETRWGIPLCLREGAARQCLLLDGKQAVLSGSGTGPLMPNAGGTGYYRFELPDTDWDALIATADRMDGNEALALSDSLRASFLAGRSSVARLAAAARQLARNPDSHASDAALDGLESLRSAGLFDPGAMAVYRRFVARIYRPSLRGKRIDFRAGALGSSDPETVQKRAVAAEALISIARDKALAGRLIAATDAYLAGDAAALDPMWLDLGLAKWLDTKGLAGARQLFERALATQDPVLRPALLDAVGSSGDKPTGKWVLDEARDPHLRASERLNLVRGVISSVGTRDMGYDWMKANLDALLNGAGGIFFAAKLPQALNGICSASRADAIAADLRPRLSGTTAALELERTIERVRACGQLQAARKAEASRDMTVLKLR